MTEPEQRVVAAAGTGSLVDLRAGEAKLDRPITGATWGAARTLAAEVLAELLVGARSLPGGGRLRAVRLRGARITGRLDLEAATLVCPLLLWDCLLEQPVNLQEARAPVIRLPGCHVPGLVAAQLETRGGLELSQGFSASGEVSLLGAHIGGTLDLEGATLTNPNGWALRGEGLTVDQNMVCRKAFSATGQVSLLGAHIGGTLTLNGATLSNPNGWALDGQQLTVSHHMLCGDGFSATGEVSLMGAHIGGALDLSEATLSNPDGLALAGARLTVDQSMFCGEGFSASGEVSLLAAHIGGGLSFSGATLTNPNGRVLDGQQLTVGRSMFCREGFSASGEVSLLAAHIGGPLDFSGATLNNPGGLALAGQQLTVDRDMACWEGFSASGEVSLQGAHIGGTLDLEGATLTNPDGRALDLYGVRAGMVRLLPRERPDGFVDFTNARVSSFDDDQATWPEMLGLRGFVYDTLTNDRVPVRARLDWLRRHRGGYTPQVYEQLAAAYRRDGRDEAARRVLIAKQWRRRGRRNPWNWLLYATVGYGYRTWLAGLWLLALLFAGTNALDDAYREQLLEPAKERPSQQPTFHPLTYALDLLLPIVNLGQEGAWIPRGWAERWTWGLVVAGWLLTTVVVAGLTGVLKRD